MNASYVDDLEGVGKVIVTQVPTLKLENWIYDLDLQGPKQNTVLDFWRMVLEHRARHIVMLTNNQEQVEQNYIRIAKIKPEMEKA